MKVFQFDKSLLNRLEEARNVLQLKSSVVPAFLVRDEWACHVELIIEPAGWQAIWKIDRATCEELNIKYPTVVFGMVNDVYFPECKAQFSVIAVQDDDIHIPEIHEVLLEDLWPTIDQENPELNIERTAECLDELRFFYQNIWMPWDDDDYDKNVDWFKEYFDSRIRFCFDLKRNMNRQMADHIRKLLTEARYIKSKRDLIDSEVDNADDPEKVSKLMELQVRLVGIRDAIRMLENPVLRQEFAKPFLSNESSEPKALAVIPKTFGEFRKALSSTVPDEATLITSLAECFKYCAAQDHIFITYGLHPVWLLEPLNSNGSLKGIYHDENKESNLDPTNNVIIKCEQSEHFLFQFNGDYTIENITLDCRNVRLGIRIRSGTVTLKNCHLIGELKPLNCYGISVSDGGTCILEKTVIEHFANGITCASGGKIVLKESTVTGCEIGLDIKSGSTANMATVQIVKCTKYGMVYSTNNEQLIGEKERIVSTSSEFVALASNDATEFTGDIAFGSNNGLGNILVVDQTKGSSQKISEFFEDNHDESEFDGEVSNNILEHSILDNYHNGYVSSEIDLSDSMVDSSVIIID